MLNYIAYSYERIVLKTKILLSFIIFGVAFFATLSMNFFADHSGLMAALFSAEQNKSEIYNPLFQNLDLKMKQYVHEIDKKPQEKELSFKGKKDDSRVVILNFWAQWCAPCLEEIPQLVQLQKKFKSKDFQIVTINTDTLADKSDVLKLIRKEKINFPIFYDVKAKIADLYSISGLPVTIVYHRGKAVRVENGSVDFMSVEFTQFIQNLLNS